jgi:hypothetical protein
MLDRGRILRFMPYSLSTTDVLDVYTSLDPSEYGDPDLVDSRSVEAHFAALDKSMFVFETTPYYPGFQKLLDRLLDFNDIVEPAVRTVAQLIKASVIYSKQYGTYSSSDLQKLTNASLVAFAPRSKSDVAHALWYLIKFSSVSLIRDKITMQYRYKTADPTAHTVLGHAGVMFPWSLLVTPVVRLDHRNALSIGLDKYTPDIVKRISNRIGAPALSSQIAFNILNSKLPEDTRSPEAPTTNR